MITHLKGFKLGDRVITEHGEGRIVSFEGFADAERAGIELDDNPFTFPYSYYFLTEIKKA